MHSIAGVRRNTGTSSFSKLLIKMVLFVLAIGSGKEALTVTSIMVSCCCCCCYSGDVMSDDVTQEPVTSPKPTQAFAWLVRLRYRQNRGMSQMISPPI